MSGRILTATRLGFREQWRRPLLVVLLIGLPFFFITRAIAVTESLPRTITLPGGESIVTTMKALHGANMATITIGFLAGLCGAFVLLSAREADRRLIVAGYRPGETILARLAVLAGATVLVVAVSMAVTALSFTPKSWPTFIAGNALVGVIFATLGAFAGAFAGRLGATYLMFFAPMIDLGVLQNPMFGSGTPHGWVSILPGYGPGRIVIDGSFSPAFHSGPELAIALAWALGLGLAVALLLRRTLGTRE